MPEQSETILPNSNLPHPLPSWVPASVVDAAQGLAAGLSDKSEELELELLWRLIADDRRALVWKEIFKKARDNNYQSTSYYIYPAAVYNCSLARRLRGQAAEVRKKGDLEDAGLMEAEARILEKEAKGKGPASASEEQEAAAAILLKHSVAAAKLVAIIYLNYCLHFVFRRHQVQKIRIILSLGPLRPRARSS